MLKLNVPDMTCGHCASTVEKAVKAVDPAAAVKVDLDRKTVTVDSAAEPARIAQALAKAGYASSAAA